MDPKITASTKLALDFAGAVTASNYERAHGFLSSSLRAAMSAEALAAQHVEMVSYGEGPPDILQAITTMDSWPDKQAGDTQWVYVAIANDTYSEAVTIVVTREQSRLVIRSIEWGRPL